MISWYYGYRFFGEGKSEWGWLLMGTSFIALLGYGIIENYNYHWSITYPVILVLSGISVLLIRKLNPWGEFFPHVPNKVLNVPDIPSWMFKWINKLAGFEYTENLTKERKIHWKMTGWVVRHGVFGLIPFIALAVGYQTLTPVFLTFIMGLGVAFVYRRSFLHPGGGDKLKRAEPLAGLVCAACMIIGVL